MNNAIFTFSKPTPGSTVVSNHLATFLAKTLSLPLHYDAKIADAKIDILFIVNGAFAFCDCLEPLGKAIRKATRIVWVQNDYTIKPPKMDGDAQSPFRRAFVRRALRGKPPTDYWTTVADNASKTPFSAYVNWNSLTYRAKGPLSVALETPRDVFYYGAYRVNRVRYFDRYFGMCPFPIVVSSTNRKFMLRSDVLSTIGGIPRKEFYRELRLHGLGLYIEDAKSHTEFHSPANRFYEMLSAGLPMVFQPESVKMLGKAGYDVSEYTVRTRKDFKRAMTHRVLFGLEQHQLWQRRYKDELRGRVNTLYNSLLRRHLNGGS